MAGCSCEQNEPFTGLSNGYKKVLVWIIGINFSLFLIEIFSSHIANSMALRADALDFLGDSVTYTISLLAIAWAPTKRAWVAVLKGLILALMGLWVLASSAYRILVLGLPNETLMGAIAILAFSANLFSALLLMRYREGDANVRSVWLCSRNDAIGNLGVLLAAVLVGVFASPWPDLLVAFLMAALFLHSSSLILRQASKELSRLKAAPSVSSDTSLE